jgi:hypothetical protein
MSAKLRCIDTNDSLIAAVEVGEEIYARMEGKVDEESIDSMAR